MTKKEEPFSPARNYEDVQAIHNYGIDIPSLSMYLFEDENYSNSGLDSPGVEYCMANSAIKNLNILVNESVETKKKKRTLHPITIYMRTPGGYVDDGMAIYDAIKSAPNHIVVVALAPASSMSSIILLAGDTKLMMPHAHYMLHEGSSGFWGTRKQVTTYADWYKKENDKLNDIYVTTMMKSKKFKGKTKKYVKKYLKDMFDKTEEVYLTPTEAMEYGFVDKVIKL